MTPVRAHLAQFEDRCSSGLHATQHPTWCACTELAAPIAPTDEWTVFVAAVRKAAVDGVVHQSAVRPLIRGKVAPKQIGQFYRRAKDRSLLVDTGEREPSNDVAGRNTDKLDRIYRLGSAA